MCRGMTWENVAWAFRTGEAGNWHPLTRLLRMLDVQIFGLRPGWHYPASLLFHTANGVLLFLLLQRMADRYTYLPLISVFMMVAWEISALTARWLSPKLLTVTASLALVACIAVTSRQLGYWQDSERLSALALEVTPPNYMALDNHGRALLKQGKLPEAIRGFSAAVEFRPDLDASRCGLGTALMEQGEYDEAADQFTRVLQFEPDHLVAQLQLGIIRDR